MDVEHNIIPVMMNGGHYFYILPIFIINYTN